MNVSFYSIAFEIQYSARLRFIFKFSINRCNISTHLFWSSLLLQSSSLCRPIGSIWNTWQLQDITVLWKCTTFAILHRRLYLKIKYNKVLCRERRTFHMWSVSTYDAAVLNLFWNTSLLCSPRKDPFVHWALYIESFSARLLNCWALTQNNSPSSLLDGSGDDYCLDLARIWSFTWWVFLTISLLGISTTTIYYRFCFPVLIKVHSI